MVRVRKYYLNIIMCCLLAVFMSFQVAAEETSKKISSKQHKAKGQQVQSPAQGQPRIVLDATTFDAGKVWEGEEVSHAFTVKNEGTAMLEIKNVKPG